MVSNEQVISSLKKLGPSSPARIADDLGAETHQVAYRLKMMLSDKAVKAAGTSNSRVYALPEQKIEHAEQENGASARTKKKRKPTKSKSRVARAAGRIARTTAVERFIPTVDADKCLHIINGGAPVSYNETQTAAIATLLLEHWG